MEPIPDYTQCSLHELYDVLQRINKEKYRSRYEQVVAEVQWREAQKLNSLEKTEVIENQQVIENRHLVIRQEVEDPRSGLVRMTLPGLAVGQMAYAAYALLIAMNSSGRADVGTALSLDAVGLVIPLMATVVGFNTQAGPMGVDHHTLMTTVSLLVTMLAAVFSLFLLYATMMSGQC